MLLKVVPTKADAILNTVKGMKKVKKAYFTFGRFDVVIFVEVEDYKELRKVTSEINEINGVRSSETLAEA